MDALIIFGIGLVGLASGSFAGAQVWRLRAKQLYEDSEYLRQLQGVKRRTPSQAAEYSELKASRTERRVELGRLSPLLDETLSSDRSRCLSCQHRLAWYDLVPVASWLSTGGKCRYCGVPIGWFELLIELGLGGFFVLSFVLWPVPLDNTSAVVTFAVWLIASVPLAILFSYDAKWFLLPDLPMMVFIGVAGLFAGLNLLSAGFTVYNLLSLLGAIIAIGGLYWSLHAVSRGRWVGYGDVTLGVGLGLLLGDWQLAVLAVFLANAIGTILILPALILGKLERQSHIPFGPLLISGAVVSYFFGQKLIESYLGLF